VRAGFIIIGVQHERRPEATASRIKSWGKLFKGDHSKSPFENQYTGWVREVQYADYILKLGKRADLYTSQTMQHPDFIGIY